MKTKIEHPKKILKEVSILNVVDIINVANNIATLFKEKEKTRQLNKYLDFKKKELEVKLKEKELEIDLIKTQIKADLDKLEKQLEAQIKLVEKKNERFTQLVNVFKSMNLNSDEDKLKALELLTKAYLEDSNL